MLIYNLRTSVLVITFAVHLSAIPLDPVQRTHDIDLNSLIRHYEPARYDPDSLGNQHNRVRRSAGQKQHIRLEIRGHGRVFRLLLTPDQEVFAEDATFESTKGPLDFNAGVAYKGTLEDDEVASVRGVVTKEGLFDGMISTPSEDYYIEPVSRYIRANQSQKSPSFHSIVYKTSDVEQPRINLPCASHLLHLNALEENISKRNFKDRTKRWTVQGYGTQPVDINMSSNQPMDDYNPRLPSAKRIDPKKTTCMLYLQADHQFFKKYGSEEACIEVMTRHVQRVNSIYKITDFNQDGKVDNITFMIKRIKVHTTEAVNDPLYRYPHNYGVEKFLELFSEEDYDPFCLAYMFTYRDFEMGTLGLAWTGDLKNAGGVCERMGHYRGSNKSLNTGIVTLLNYGKHVPPAVSHVTLAHEIGHNFGSPHDPEICTPGGEDGNFIMFARATSGDKKNNNQFSPCSLKSINPVLSNKARNAKGCFKEPQKSVCGNGVVEEGEECDCGWEEDCRDRCCFPQRNYPPLDEPPCHLTPDSFCSPSQGPCCTPECEVKFGDLCRRDNGCREPSYCNGRNPQCPPSINKPNKTICNQEFVCFMGECTGSICLAYGLESCQCIPGPNDPKTKSCELCCKLPGEKQPCKSSFEWNEMPYDVPNMFSKPGTPCNDYNGYCDVFQVCREVDPSGPLATLRKLLLSEESIASFKKWMMEYWYAVALILSAAVALLLLSTRLLGKKPKLKLKSITIMHNSSEAVRLPADGDGGQVTVHPAVRSKVPLKRKVRDGKLRKKHKAKGGSKVKKSPKKKKRVSAPVGAEEARNKKTGDTAAVIEVPPSKVKKSPQHATPTKKRKKKKEIIDYSKTQTDKLKNGDILQTSLTQDTDPMGKVQNWLLKSQLALPKSKSTPAGLTDKTTRSPHKRPTIRPRTEKNKSHSIGNLPSEKEKVRLQVVYKPPFKFSVKLRKPEKNSVVVERVIDRTKKIENKTPRTGLLVRTVKEHEPKPQKPSSKPEDVSAVPVTSPVPLNAPPTKPSDDIDSNVHTVQSDLEVLLSESEFLFSDD